MNTAACAITESPPNPAETEMRAGLPVEEVRARLGEAARREETGQRVLAFYLVEMDARRLYQASGHGSTAHYAEVRVGIDRRRTAELLRVGGRLLELREVDRAFCAGRIGWAKVLLLARAATPPHEAAWLERALALDCRELARLVRRSREGGPPRKAGETKGLPEIRFPVAASLGVLAHARLDRGLQKLGDELGRAVGLADLLDALVSDFLASDAEGNVPGRKRVEGSLYRVVLTEENDAGGAGGALLAESEDGPLPIDESEPGGAGALGEAVRCDAETLVLHGEEHVELDVKTPPALRRKVLTRDGARCRSCRSRHGLMVHHLAFRSEGGRTSAENLISLCTRCHGLVHAGLLATEGETAAEARFVDAARGPLAGTEAGAGIEAPALGAPEASAIVTLERVPEVVDTAWWRAHAHLFRDRGEQGGLRFEAGIAMIEAAAPPSPPVSPAQAFAGLVGQEARVERLQAVAEGARARGRPFPHTLFTGPAGTGKTRLARGIAASLGRRPVEITAPLVTERATWVRLLASLEEGDVLFLDEAHALPRALVDTLLQALAEARLTLAVSDGVRARAITLVLPRFTLVAATTDEGRLPASFRSRFGLREPLVHYGPEELATLVRAAAQAQGAETTPEAARRLAESARGTPREALRLLDRALDDAAARGVPTAGTTHLDAAGAGGALTRLGYDPEGLDPTEHRYVEVLRESRTPVPLSRLSRMLGASPGTLVEHVEPYLFERGLVHMTLGGRAATPRLRRTEASSGLAGAPNVRRISTGWGG